MANPAADSWSITLGTPNKLTLHSGLQNFTFPLAPGCPLPVMPADIAALQAHDDAAVQAAVDKVLAALQQQQSSGGTASADPPPTTGGGTPTPPAPPAGQQQTVQVGPTRAFVEPADAVDSVAPGGTMVLDDGVYTKAFHCGGGITIKSASGNPFKCYFDGRGGNGGGHRMAWGKGMIHCDGSAGNATFDGIGFRNCGSPASGDNYSNEAALWFGDSDGSYDFKMTVRRCSFDGGANGVFTSGDSRLTVIETECIFGFIAPTGQNAYANGSGGHPAHDNYLECGTVEVSGCYFYGSIGHNVKLRTAKWNVHDNPCMMQDGGRAVDAADGGTGNISGNTFWTRTDRQGLMVGNAGGRYGNSNMIGYALESASQGAADLPITNNTLHITRNNSTIAVQGGVRGQAKGNTVNCYGSGSLQVQGTVIGLDGVSAPPGAPATAPAWPKPPSWATP